MWPVSSSMLSFALENCRFNFRVAGLALHDGHLLLHHALHEPFWTAPGGRCEAMEPTHTTVVREFAEELNVMIVVERLAAVVENFFAYEGARCHELCFYYRIALPENSSLLDRTIPISAVDMGVPLEFRWFAVDRLEEVEIRPTCLARIVRWAEEHPLHIVHNEFDPASPV